MSPKDAGGGKTIDLGRKYGAEIKAKEPPTMSYPSLYVERVDKENPLAKMSVGSTFDGTCLFKVKRVSESDDGMCIDLEARSLKL